MKQTAPLEPAHSIIAELGGCVIVAGIVGIGRDQVWRWTQPKPKGTDGKIPVHHHETLLAWSRVNGKSLTPESFFLSTKTASNVITEQRIVA